MTWAPGDEATFRFTASADPDTPSQDGPETGPREPRGPSPSVFVRTP